MSFVVCWWAGPEWKLIRSETLTYHRVLNSLTSPGGVCPNASSTTSAGTDMTSSSVRWPSWFLSSNENRCTIKNEPELRQATVDHFRIPFCLCFKTRPSAKLFLVKMSLIRMDMIVKGKHIATVRRQHGNGLPYFQKILDVKILNVLFSVPCLISDKNLTYVQCKTHQWRQRP